VSSLLVTGGAGFTGTNFVLRWLRLHPQDYSVVLDALTYAGNRSNLRTLEGSQWDLSPMDRAAIWHRELMQCS
jgi:dTDP-glucose 4,6-dehydratase